MKDNPGLLSFDQPVEFYLRRSLRYREEDRWPEAAQDLWTALEKGGEAPEVVLDLAQVLSGMGLFEASNDLLLPRLSRPEIKSAEAYMTAGQNFLNLNAWDIADDCLNLALMLDPSEETEDRILSLLEILDDTEEEEEPDEEEEPRPLRLVGEDMPEGGLLSEAVRKMQARKYEEGIRLLDRHLQHVPDDVRALCGKARALYHLRRREESNEVMDRAVANRYETTAELTLLADTLSLLHRDEDVAALLEPLVASSPERANLLFLQGVAYYNTGRYDKAQEALRRLRMAEPESPLLDWYLDQCVRAQEGKRTYPALSYGYMLPVGEKIRFPELLGSILDACSDDPSELLDRTDLTDALKRFIETQPETDPIPLLRILTGIQGKKAEPYLRKLLIRLDFGPETKKQIMAFLGDIGAEQPYVALTEHGLVEAVVNIIDESAPPAERVEMYLKSDPPFDWLPSRDRLVRFWRFLTSEAERNGIALRISGAEAWAAAVIYVYVNDVWRERKITMETLASLYQTSVPSVSKHAKVLREILAASEETEE